MAKLAKQCPRLRRLRLSGSIDGPALLAFVGNGGGTELTHLDLTFIGPSWDVDLHTALALPTTFPHLTSLAIACHPGSSAVVLPELASASFAARLQALRSEHPGFSTPEFLDIMRRSFPAMRFYRGHHQQDLARVRPFRPLADDV